MNTKTPNSFAARAFGMAIGNLFLGCFGMAWIVLGLLACGQGKPVTLAMLGCFLAALVAASIYILRRTHPLLDRSETTRAIEKKRGRRFGLINAVQWGLIFTAIFILNCLKLQLWIVPTVILIVGLHFFPLAWLFDNREHYLTGSVIVVWAFLYPILFSPGKGDPTGSIGMGAILWTSAAYLCWRAFQFMREPRPASARLALY